MQTVSIRIKRLKSNSSNPLPAYMTVHSAGMDLYAELEAPLIINSGERTLVPTGLAIGLPDGYEAQVRPRSGLALKHGVTLLNTPGTIDADYRGEIGVILINHGALPFEVNNGDRIAQLIVAPVSRAVLVEVEELDATKRGIGGFGHTGR